MVKKSLASQRWDDYRFEWWSWLREQGYIDVIYHLAVLYLNLYFIINKLRLRSFKNLLFLSSYILELGFPCGSDSKDSACNVGDLGSIPGLGRSPGGGHGNPLQYSCLENPHGQRSLVGYSPWGLKDLDMTEWQTTHIGVILPYWLEYSESNGQGFVLPGQCLTGHCQHWPWLLLF